MKSNYKDEVKSVPLSSKNYLANSFDQLITPARNTIGVKMARKMVISLKKKKILFSYLSNVIFFIKKGWREGQGVGPRIKRKLRNLKTKIYHGKKYVMNNN